MIKPKNKYISFDLSLHKTLSEFNKISLNQNAPLDVLINLLDNNWISIGFDSSQEEELFKNKALITLMNYYTNPLDKGIENFIIDKFINFTTTEDLNISCKIDKLHELNDGLFEVIDYKSGIYIPHQSQIFNSLKVHKIVYLSYKKLDIYPDLFSYYYLRYNKKFTLKITKDYIDFLNFLF